MCLDTLHSLSFLKMHSVMHIYGIQKNGDEPICKSKNRDADIENGLVDRVEKGEGGMNGESNIKIYTLPCGKQKASGKLLYNTRSSAWWSLITQWGGWGVVGGGERGRLKRQGMYVYLWLTHDLVKQKSTQHC